MDFSCIERSSKKVWISVANQSPTSPDQRRFSSHDSLRFLKKFNIFSSRRPKILHFRNSRLQFRNSVPPLPPNLAALHLGRKCIWSNRRHYRSRPFIPPVAIHDSHSSSRPPVSLALVPLFRSPFFAAYRFARNLCAVVNSSHKIEPHF